MGSSQSTSTSTSLAAAAGPVASEPVTQAAVDRVGTDEGCAGGAPAVAGPVASEPVAQSAADRAGAGAGAGAAGGADEGAAATGRSPVGAAAEACTQRVGATCGTTARLAMKGHSALSVIALLGQEVIETARLALALGSRLYERAGQDGKPTKSGSEIPDSI